MISPRVSAAFGVKPPSPAPEGGKRWKRLSLVAVICSAIAASCGSDNGSVERADSADAAEASLEIEVPSDPVIADWPFDVTTSWRTEQSRELFVALIKAAACGKNLQAGLALDPSGTTLVQETVAGSGHRVDQATITTTGSYLVCGYLQDGDDPATPAEVVQQAPHPVQITTFADTPSRQPKLKSCGRVGGPRRIYRVRASNLTCRRARSIARRWGATTPAPEAVRAYSCHARRQAVTCTASERREVRFRYR